MQEQSKKTVSVAGATSKQSGEPLGLKIGDSPTTTMTPRQLRELGDRLQSNVTLAPIAADESKATDKFWDSDPCDDVIPTARGFVSDCIYYHRGREAPSLYTVWASLFAVASAVKRDAWLAWADGRMFANLYVMIVGPAGAVKKNTAIDLAAQLLDGLEVEVKDLTGDDNIAGMKVITPFVSTASKEALVTAMMPSNQRGPAFDFTMPNGDAMLDDAREPIRYTPRSEIAICQRELGAFIGRSSYMDSMMPYLTDMFDAPDRMAALTQTRGKEELLDVLVNMIGATAPAALKETLPTAALADGFLSRCLIVYQSCTDREFFRPKVPAQAPNKQELKKRLAWIAANTFGEWDMSPEAEEWMQQWYHKYKQQLRTDGLFMGVRSRLDVIMLRIALLIRWQRFERGNSFIQLQDLKDAERLIHRTFQESIPIYRMLFDKNSNDKSLKTEEFIRRVKRIQRSELIQRAHVPAEDAFYAVQRLLSEGLITITLKGQRIEESRREPTEIYTWVGEELDDRVLNDKPAPEIFVARRMPKAEKEKPHGPSIKPTH